MSIQKAKSIIAKISRAGLQKYEQQDLPREIGGEKIASPADPQTKEGQDNRPVNTKNMGGQRGKRNGAVIPKKKLKREGRN